MSQKTTIVWYRKDLRVADHEALNEAAARGPVIPVFIWAPDEEGEWVPGGASRWWFHRSLKALDQKLQGLGSRLVIRRGPSLDTLIALAEETGADAVFWHRRYEPAIVDRDTAVKHGLRVAGLTATSFNGSLLYEPWTVSTQQDQPYKVYTPFWKRTQEHHEPPPQPCDTAKSLPAPSEWPRSLDVDDLGLDPTIDWDAGLRKTWTPGEDAGHKRLDLFLNEILTGYADSRNVPGVDGTSRMSPYLHHGEISPRQAWHAVRDYMTDGRRKLDASQKQQCWVYLKELVWREFSYHVLFHFPRTPSQPLKEKYEAFEWVDMRQGRHWLEVWQKGQTGYPIVDAAVRQLWEIGWMHNRCRMIVASFLIKHLRVPWQEGAKWFWDTLVDADLADNTMGWQWSAGCGADAQPFFRIFNPMSQGEKFDPKGDYVRRYVPELKSLPDDVLHTPWKASPEVLERAGVTLGKTYPRPIVDHREAREAALQAYEAVK